MLTCLLGFSFTQTKAITLSTTHYDCWRNRLDYAADAWHARACSYSCFLNIIPCCFSFLLFLFTLYRLRCY